MHDVTVCMTCIKQIYVHAYWTHVTSGPCIHHVYEWHCVYVHTGHMSRAIHYLISIIRHMCMHDMSHVHTWHVTCVWMTQIMYIQDTCHMIHISIYMSHVHAWVCMTCHMHIQNMGLWIRETCDSQKWIFYNWSTCILPAILNSSIGSWKSPQYAFDVTHLIRTCITLMYYVHARTFNWMHVTCKMHVHTSHWTHVTCNTTCTSGTFHWTHMAYNY